ncbi:hypothetical protein [Thiosulfativibrio zosterae]|uniref:Uncharacterized protein n=1 Tax=Thiosulfativibrio zosterae TaxID=2675053 RepID=A0A6F8PMU9_9GAMM|nr:hypothetical protein [Thiosulfativibrio zosterae]BBP43367.1 hypothetical protein THMIRHAT_11130 [Thiosulfativibrio zosterae]
MDLLTRLFLYGGAALAAIFLMVALMTLSHSTNGQLTVEGVSEMSDAMQSFYELIRWFVYPWMAVALAVFVRFLYRTFK